MVAATACETGPATSAFNDDCEGFEQKQAIVDAGFAPNEAAEPALRVSLPPGLYTPIVAGKEESVGLARVELYSIAEP